MHAYKMCVEPILNYAATLWSPHTSRGINKVESVQKRAAAHLIVKDYRRTSSITQIFNILSLKPIEEMNINLFCHKPPSIPTNIIFFPRSINLWNKLPIS